MKKAFAYIANKVVDCLIALGIGWLLSYIPTIRATVMPLLWDIVPSQQKTVWLLSATLFVLGLFGLSFAFRELVNQEIFRVAERIRDGTATDKDRLIAHYVVENAKKPDT
jgi:hypothetical protein